PTRPPRPTSSHVGCAKRSGRGRGAAAAGPPRRGGILSHLSVKVKEWSAGLSCFLARGCAGCDSILSPVTNTRPHPFVKEGTNSPTACAAPSPCPLRLDGAKAGAEQGRPGPGDSARAEPLPLPKQRTLPPR